MNRLLITLVAIALLVTPAAAQDFQKGMRAYHRGDYETALEQWRPLAEQGIAEAQNNLGTMYAQGRGVPQDYRKAREWFLRASEQSHPDAANSLGTMARDGLGDAPDNTEALTWFYKAAELGFAPAQANLGALFYNQFGKEIEGYIWFYIAAKNGDEVAQKNLEIVARHFTPEEIELNKAMAEGIMQELLKKRP